MPDSFSGKGGISSSTAGCENMSRVRCTSLAHQHRRVGDHGQLEVLVGTLLDFAIRIADHVLLLKDLTQSYLKHVDA